MKFDVTANGVCVYTTENGILTLGKINGDKFTKVSTRNIEGENVFTRCVLH